jgi:DNA primase
MAFHHIPNDILQDILNSVNIREVIEGYVPLKKSGQNWVGLCPFHADTDPSFSVNEAKQIFYCFGCGQGGNAISFLTKFKGIKFIEAVQELAKLAGKELPVQPLSPQAQLRKKEHQELIEVNETAAAFYHDQLLHSGRAAAARQYLKHRGLSLETIQQFRIGYAPDTWDGLLTHLKTNGIDSRLALAAGLLVQREDGSGMYDRFRNRIIFPIQDRGGRVIALGGRALGDAMPKYLNSPESPIYKKSNSLYGLYANKNAILQHGYGYIVEGYMDLLALWQAGVKPVLATLGTALTEEHIKTLKGLVKDWILVFDGDSAGINATLRAIPLFYAAGLRVKAFILPEKDDPDTYIRRHGPEVWEMQAAGALSGLDFLLEHGLKTHGNSPEGKAQTMEDAMELIKLIQDPVRKALIITHVAQAMGVKEDSLWRKLENMTVKRPQPMNRPTTDLNSTQQAVCQTNRAEQELLGFILDQPRVLPLFLKASLEIWLTDPILKSLWLVMTHHYSVYGSLNPQELVEDLQSTPHLREALLTILKKTPPSGDVEALTRGMLRYCEAQKKKAMRQGIQEQILAAQTDEEREELLKKLQALT